MICNNIRKQPYKQYFLGPIHHRHVQSVMLSHITNRHRYSYVNIINPTHEEKKLKSNSILGRCFSVNDGKVIKWVNQISDVTKDIKINETNDVYRIRP